MKGGYVKRLFYILVLLSGMFIISNVNADTYKEGSFKSPSCNTNVDELKKASEDYSFDKKTGKFSVSGRKYSTDLTNLKSFSFFRTSKDRKTLYVYVLSYNNTSEFVSALNLPKYDCDDIYKAEKTSVKVKETSTNSTSGNDKTETKDNNTKDETNNKEENNKENNKEDKLTDDNSKQNEKQKSNDKTSSKEKEKSKKNTTTILCVSGLVLVFAIIAVVLKKKKIIG